MDFILEIPNHLPKELCEEMIKLFENDSNKKPGVTGPPGKHMVSSVKKSMDLTIPDTNKWNNVSKCLYDKIEDGIKKYMDHLREKGCSSIDYHLQEYFDYGYQIKKTTTGEYYSWHSDGLLQQKRFLVFIWYLNDLHPIYDGGGTAFHPTIGCGKVVTPDQGKLLIFPATWTYFHTGLPIVSNKSKYICTVWICDRKD